MANDSIRAVTKINDELLFDRFILRCAVNILMVTDSGSGGYSTSSGFHLGRVLEILASDPWPHVQFVVTKAHRDVTAEAGVIDNFRFNTHDLSGYDQVWLFGIQRTSNPLTPAELRALSQFMDAGGGVFATGDHEDLGRAMAAEVPRVRSMRRWYWPTPGPNGEPVAPAQIGSERHDTLVLPFNQSDEVPQHIRPKLYVVHSGGAIFKQVVKYPHPVLCGPNGVIDYLPDHMHEGVCEVPADVSKSYTFDGYTTVEYPTVAGHQERPQIIAWATNTVTGDEFGVIGAYDGHRVGVGRAVVDATWHHWFNINLEGFLQATDPANPAYDPAVVPRWEEIKAYFRNVAAWLSPKTKQRCLRNGALLLATQYTSIVMSLRDPESHAKAGTLHTYYWNLGVLARDALGRLAPRCQRSRWILEVLELLPLPNVLPDPWGPPRPLPDPPPWFELEDLETVALGGAIHSLGLELGKRSDLDKVMSSGLDEIDKLTASGSAEALSTLVEAQKKSLDSLEKLSRQLRAKR